MRHEAGAAVAGCVAVHSDTLHGMAWQAVANPRKEVALLAVDLDMQRGLTEPVSPVQSSPVQFRACAALRCTARAAMLSLCDLCAAHSLATDCTDEPPHYARHAADTQRCAVASAAL